MISLGMDIGSNSVGSAWVDTEKQRVCLGVGIFPAGVDETDTKRGSPINQKRREKRSQRRSIARRAKRKHALRKLLVESGLLPSNTDQLARLLDGNPWELRRGAVDGTLCLLPYGFGRVILHLNQRRGALGVEADPEEDGGDEEEGKVKEAIHHLRTQLKGRTFGHFVADLMDERRHAVSGKDGKFFQDPVRNRRDKFEFHADRTLIREEFNLIWVLQRSAGGDLARILTDELKARFDDPSENDTWRHKGVLFGQRRTYWDAGTLGRCDLEPTDLRCSMADMYAQEFRVLETVNNIRVGKRGEAENPLGPEERTAVMAVLRKQKSASADTVRSALGIDKRSLKKKGETPDFYSLNLDRDEEREINTDWFYRAIIHGALRESTWQQLESRQRDSVNRAILKFDPDKAEHATELREGATKWWGLSSEAAEKLVAAWKSRPKIDNRINLSRRALLNLLPYLRKGLSVSEARQCFADNGATTEQRARYDLRRSLMSKADRHFMEKHPNLLPPAPTLANPVVRKAIHEVRRHLVAYLRAFKRKPDRIVIELTRSAKQSEKVRNNILANNRKREKERRADEDEFKDFVRPDNPMHRIVDRVRLWREQRQYSAYSDTKISMEQVGHGWDLEIDHITPLSRSQDNGFNNKVLCLRNENRDKTNATAREWLERRGLFANLEQRLAHLEKENPRKWENLHRECVPGLETPEEREAWGGSQLTDTAYAATQVGDYLRNALFDGERDGKRRVFFTKGSYTGMLRKDWQLQEREGPKERIDHRHHAIDAVVIAMTGPEIIAKVAADARYAAEHKQRTGHWPPRPPVNPPWGTVEEFRAQVMTEAGDQIVSHRPVKRKITGYFHKEDLWGAVDEAQGIFRIRSKISELSPKMLRLPVEELDADVKRRLYDRFKKLKHSDKDARAKTKAAFEQGRFKRLWIDPSLGKGGLVRDWDLRRIIRDSLREHGINPDDFAPKQIADFAQSGKLKMPSGVPIRSVITIGPMSDPVKIAVKDPLTQAQAVNSRTGEPLFRFHFSRNNHHVEIQQHMLTGEWSGECVTTFQAAQRVRPPKDAAGNRQPPGLAVDRSTRENKIFIMSLSEGETIHASRRDRSGSDAVGYFVVAKLDATRIWFSPHADSRNADEQDRWDVSYADLKACGPESGVPPCKVRVGPLGTVTRLIND